MKLFSLSGSRTILVFFVPNLIAIFRRATNAGGVEKSRFSTDISLYLGNNTRRGHSYYGTAIGTRMQSIEWCHFYNDLK